MMKSFGIHDICSTLGSILRSESLGHQQRRFRRRAPGAEYLESRVLLSGVKPYLQNPAPDAMTVIWFTEANAAGTLTVNLPGGGTQVLSSTPELKSELAYHSNEATTGRSNAPWMHRIRVTGLTPETSYNYTVNQGIETFAGQLRTSPSETSSVRFIVYGDSEAEPESTGAKVQWTQPGNPGATRQYVVDQTVGYSENLKVIESRNPDFIGIAGDIVESGGEQRDWDEFWRHNAGDINDVASSTPIFAAPGNHENYGGPGAFGGYGDVGSIRAQGKFKTYWEAPSNGTSAYDDRYYRVDYGPITYISLDVTNGQPNGTSSDTNWLLGDGPGYPDFNPGSIQYQWLEAQLADAQANSRFTFVQFHHVPYSTGPHGFPAGTGAGFDNQSGVPVRALTPLFAQYGVDAVLSGHDETYQHSLVDGVHFFDVGMGGDGLRGPSSGPDSANPTIITNPFQVFTAHLNAPEVWNGPQLISGGKHYGHMEINVTFDAASGTWKAQLDPVYIFPLMDVSGNVTGWERRIYNDTTVLTANAAPTEVLLWPSVVAENLPVGTTVGLMSSVDAMDDTHTYSLVSGVGSDNNGSFTINGNMLKTNASFDFETKNTYTVRVRSTDQDNLSFEQSLTINVSDVTEGTTAALIGVDFGGGNIPGNWNSFSGASDSTLNNLIDETGNVTGISAVIARDSAPGIASSFTPLASTLPQHAQSLAGVDRIYQDQFGNIQLTWGNLTPGAAYEIYVFGGNEISGNPKVTITGDAAISFGQSYAANQLMVNDQVGDSTRTLSSYAKFMNANASGQILVRVDTSNGVSWLGTAGMAIRPVLTPPDITVTLSSGAGSISEAGGTTTLTASLSEPAMEDVFVNLQMSGTAVNNTDYRITSGAAPISIDGNFRDWHNNPAVVYGVDPLNDTHDTDTNGAGNTPLYVNHPDVDLRAFGVTHDDQNLYFYFRSEGQIGRTQVASPGKAAGRFYVIVTMDVDQNDATGYQLHQGGYYPTTPGYDMNSEVEFFNGTFNTGHYLNHGATDLASLNQAFAEQSNNGYNPALASQDIQGPFNPGFLRVIPGSYDFYSQWVYKNNDPANGGNDSITFVKDKGPIVPGIITQQVSADGHELEMIVPYKGFLIDQNGNPIVDIGKILDLSFSLEASGELAPAPGNTWASDTANPLNGYALTATNAAPVNVIRIPKGQTSASVQITALDNSVISPNRSAVIEIGSVTGAVENGTQLVTLAITDDEVQSLIVSSTAVSVTEGGASAFAVSLSVQPAANVVVNVARSSGDSDLSVTDGAALTFTTTNWNTPQTVTLAAAEDVDLADGSAVFSVTSAGVTTVDVTATEVDTSGAFSIVENTTAVTTVPGGAGLAFSITGGADQTKFSINPATGALVFAAAPNFESPTDVGGNNVYDVIVGINDGVNPIVTKAIAVTVTNVNESPVNTTGSAFNVAENTTTVTTVTGTDPENVALTFSITGGADAAKFTINPTTGALAFAVAPNFEAPDDAGANNVYNVTVGVSDSVNSVVTKVIAVTVTNVNEAPVNTTGSSFNVAENTTAVTTVTGTDPENVALTFSITGGADAAKFTINPTTGALAFAVSPNFEAPTDAGANNVYDVIVGVSDGVNPVVTKAVAVTVTAVNESPVNTTGGTFNVAENSTAVTTVTGTDPENAALTFSIAGGADQAKFTINATTGALAFAVAPNFESPTDAGANNVFDVIVGVSDGVNPVITKAVAVTVTNVNESPVNTTGGAFNVAQNTTAVTTVTGTDPENAALAFSIAGGADATKFSINPTTGALVFAVAPIFGAPTDVGLDNVYDVIVGVSDGVNPVVTKAVAVTVTVINLPPLNTTGSTFNIAENTTAVTTVTGTDPENVALTYSITGGADAAKFTVNTTTGALTFVSAPNFETPTDAGANNVYDVIVGVSDGVNPVVTKAITVTVTDTNEATFSGNIFYNQNSGLEKNFSPDQTGQRSMVRRLQVVFNGDVSVPLGAVTNSSFVVAKLGTTNTNVGITVVSSNFSAGKTTVVLGFTSGIEASGSLVDGNYRLLIDYGILGIDGDGNGLVGGTKTINFHRFFGDGDGDRIKDARDAIMFLQGVRGNPVMLSLFDWNNNGSMRAGSRLDVEDRDAFFKNLGNVLNPF